MQAQGTMATSIGNDTPKSPDSSIDRSPGMGDRHLDEDKESNGEMHNGYSFSAPKSEEPYSGRSIPGSPTGDQLSLFLWKH